MQIFNAVMKVISKNKGQLIIFFVVFISVTIMVTGANGPAKFDYAETKCNIAFFNEDKDSAIAKGLGDYLSGKANIRAVEDKETALQDELFFRRIEYIVRIPEGFTDSLRSGGDVRIEKTAVPDTTAGIYLDNLINKYVNTAKLYMKNAPDLTPEEIAAQVSADMAGETPVEMAQSKTAVSEINSVVYFFNYFAYAVFGILILGVSVIMLTFNQSDLKRRNLCSPLRARTMNLGLLFGNLSLAVFTWFIVIVISFILYSRYMVGTNAALLILNSFIFTISALSIAFLIANLIRSKGAVSAASNVVALGCSFLSGVFVPQYLLSDSVMTIASFTPSYWYVKANNDIGELVSYTADKLMPVFTSMLIELGFAVAVFAVTLVVMKQRRTSA